MAAVDAATASNLAVVSTSAGVLQTARFDVLMGALARLGKIYIVTDPQFGVRADGTDETARAQLAYDAANANGGGIVIWPPGLTYKIAGQILGYSNVHTSAHGANFTAGTQSATTGGLFLFSGTVGTAYLLTGNTTEAAVTVTLSPSDAANFATGDHVWLYDTTTLNSADYKRERNIVESVVSGTVTLRYPLNFAYLTASSAQIKKVTPVENVIWDGGSFDLTGVTGEYDAIQCNWGYNVEVRNIRPKKFTGKGVQFWDGLNVHATRVTALNPTDVSAGHGYAAQFIYCRHFTSRDVYGENCRHVVDITGGSDWCVHGQGVTSLAGNSASFHTHGLYSKRGTFDHCEATGAEFGVLIGNGSFAGDEAIEVVGTKTHRCKDALMVMNGSTNIKFRGGKIHDSVQRALVSNASTDVTFEDIDVDGILTNPSNYGAVDLGSANDRVKVRNVRVRNPIYQSVRIDGSGEYTFEDIDLDQSASAKAIGGANVTGDIYINGGIVRQATTSTAVDLTCTGGTARVIVNGLTSKGTGGSAAAAGVKVTGAALFTARDVTTANVSEAVRGDDCTVMTVASSHLEVASGGNCIRAAGTTATLYLGQNTYAGTNNIPLANTASALLLGGADAAGIRAVTTTYTQAQNDSTILANATGGAFTVALLAALRMTGRRVTIKKIDASANAVTIDGSGAETIDGAATVALSTQFAFRTIQSDGTQWHVVSS